MPLLQARVSDWWRTWWPAVLLGVLTVGSYGLVLYGFGVISGPIQEEEGWSSGATNAAFMGSYLLGAAGSIVSGRVLDAIGPRPVLAVGLIGGTGLLIAASFAGSVWLFIPLWALGGAITIAGLFYNVTMPITARLYPHRQTAAMTVLVTTGGFSSVVFLPLTGLLTDELGWRWAVRILLVLAATLVIPALLTVRKLPPVPADGAASNPGAGAPRVGFSNVRDAVRSPEVLLMLAVVAVSSFGLGALLNHFVPAATAAGLSITAGGFLTGLRGFLSIPGRALIGPMAGLLGLRPALGVGYAVMLLGTLALDRGRSALLDLRFRDHRRARLGPDDAAPGADRLRHLRPPTNWHPDGPADRDRQRCARDRALCGRSALRRPRRLHPGADRDRRRQLHHAAAAHRPRTLPSQDASHPAVTLSINHCGRRDGCRDGRHHRWHNSGESCEEIQWDA